MAGCSSAGDHYLPWLAYNLYMQHACHRHHVGQYVQGSWRELSLSLTFAGRSVTCDSFGCNPSLRRLRKDVVESGPANIGDNQSRESLDVGMNTVGTMLDGH